MLKILYVSIGSFWNNACMKNFQHHDLLFKYMDELESIIVDIAIPMQGPSHLSRLLDGNGMHLVQSVWRDDIQFIVHPSLKDIKNYDCMIINGSENFQDIELLNGSILSGEEISKWVINKAEESLKNGIPVILYDQDNYVNERLGSKDATKNLAYMLFRKFRLIKGFYLTGPFKFGQQMLVGENKAINEYTYIPFVVDDDISLNIKSLNEKSYFVKYAGNNYHRDNFIDYFIHSSKYGNVLVNGSGWRSVSREYSDNNRIQFKPKFPLTYEKVNDYYGDSVIGLYGTTNIESFRNYGHYTLRIREFYQAGIPFAVEDLDYLQNLNLFPGYNIFEQIDLFGTMNGNNHEYINMVEEQRRIIKENFSARYYSKILYDIIKRGVN